MAMVTFDVQQVIYPQNMPVDREIYLATKYIFSFRSKH